MNRHEYRVKTVTAVYRHLLLKKELELCFAEEFDQDDNEFITVLKNDIISNITEYTKEISSLLNNWDFDRLNYVDQAILIAAASEYKAGLNNKKIVIDEAIRIAKQYCDEESYKYINGVLDRL